MVRWLRWHCHTGFKIRALAVCGRARYLSVTEAPHNTDFHTWMGKKHFCFFETPETGNRTPNSGAKGSGADHYPRAPAHKMVGTLVRTYLPRNSRYVGTNWYILVRSGRLRSGHGTKCLETQNVRGYVLRPVGVNCTLCGQRGDGLTKWSVCVPVVFFFK